MDFLVTADFQDPMLEAVGVAGYQWGSMLLETTALFQADGNTIVRTFAGAMRGVLPFDSDVEMRTALAILHELVHLKQDVGTGIGANDHLVLRDASLRLVSESRWLISRYNEPPYSKAAHEMLDELGDSPFTRQMRGDLAAVHASTIALRQLRGDTWLDAPTRRALLEAMGHQIPDGDLTRYSLRRLLESQAACSLYLHVSTSRASKIGNQIIEEQRHLWNPVLMDDSYFGGILDVARAIDAEISGQELSKGLLAYAAAVDWVVDFACAYPPPTLVASSEIDQALFDPVVRYLLALRVIVLMPFQETSLFMEAVAMRRWFDAEDIFAGYVPVSYPPLRETYESWVHELRPLAETSEWDAPLFQARIAMFEARLSHDQTGNLQLVFDSQVPIQVLVENAGIRGILWGKDLLDESMREALILRNTDRELLELFYGSGRYRCPYGRANICEDRLPECSAGISRFSQFPVEEQCLIRRQLQQVGYSI